MTGLIDNFREQALKLVDMLDVSIPVVGKLKVRHYSFIFFRVSTFGGLLSHSCMILMIFIHG